MQPAVEILLNTSLIAELIKNGEITQIKEAMEQSLYPGSQTFEQALCRLYLDGQISYDEAMVASDSPTNLAWLINQNSPTARVDIMTSQARQRASRKRPQSDFTTLQIEPKCSTAHSRRSRGAGAARGRRAAICYHWAHGRRRPARIGFLA